MREITITKDEAGQRINKYLCKYLNCAPSSFVYKMIRKKNIKLNNQKIDGSEILYVGDSIQIYMSDETIANFRRDPGEDTYILNANKFKLDVVYSDENILIANKPAGILSQRASRGDYSVNEALMDYLLENNKITREQLRTFKPSICNRLDRNTSGIILCSTSLTGSQELSRIVRERMIDKYYFTIVKGSMHDIIDNEAFLYKDEKLNLVTVSDKEYPDRKPARIHTRFFPVRTNEHYTMVKAELITGKSHQIRAQLAYLGYPVVGDAKYGNDLLNKNFSIRYHLKHHLLHCESVVFNVPDGPLSYLDGKTFTTFLPDMFKKIEKDLFK